MYHPLHILKKMPGPALQISPARLGASVEGRQGLPKAGGGPLQAVQSILQKRTLALAEYLDPGLRKEVFHHPNPLVQEGGGFSHRIAEKSQERIQLLLTFQE
jgi:hypothetical protein